LLTVEATDDVYVSNDDIDVNDFDVGIFALFDPIPAYLKLSSFQSQSHASLTSSFLSLHTSNPKLKTKLKKLLSC